MSLFFGLISGGIAGSAVFGILMLFRPITEKLFSKGWHYYSLLVPLFFLLGGTLLAGNLIGQARHFRAGSSRSEPIHIEATQTHSTLNIPINPSVGDSVFRGYIGEETHTPERSAPSLINERMLRFIGRAAPFAIAVWAVGAVLFLGIGVVKYLKYRRLVLRKAVICREIDCKIPVVVSPVAHTPMLIGLFKPVIVLPNTRFEYAELSIILTHELVHHKRKDLLLKMAGLLANAVHWYNPAVYSLGRQINTNCELSCDEKVAFGMDSTGRRFYGETILQVLQHSTTQRSLAGNPMFATNFCNSKKHIKRRLISMMKVRKMKKSVAALALAAVMLVAGGGFAISHVVDFTIPVHAASRGEDTGFREPEMTVYVITADDAEVVTCADALSPEDAAMIGARYIWDMFGECIDGKFVALAYSDWPSYTRTWWSGTVIESEAALYGEPGLFFFIIDAVTGERIDIVRRSPAGISEEVGAMLADIRRDDVDGSRFREFISGSFPPPANLDEHARIAKEHASRHFTDTEVVSAVFVSVSATGFDFIDDVLIVTSRYILFEVTDSTGRAAYVSFNETTGGLDRIITQHNDILPEIQTRREQGRPMPPQNPDGSLG